MVGLKEKYKDYFKVGAAVNIYTVDTHKELLIKHFNSITCENETKFVNIQPEENNYEYDQTDKILSFAKKNNIAMRGHTMVWHNQTPDWVFKDATRDILLERMKNHIYNVGKKYKNDFYCWDVVNEAIEDKKDLFYRKSPWLEIIGEDFMDYAFNYAREVLPDTDLYYNDYNESEYPKRDKIYKAIKDMLDRGVPVDGVGLQCHWNICSPSMDDFKQAMEQYAKLGIKIQVTEMDLSVFDFKDETRLDKPGIDLLKKQAAIYKEGFKILREYKDIVDTVTLWGVADDATWLDDFPVKNRKNWPLLFDENHEPKEALYAIMDF
ncbi:MAG: endo-1,4-beta-xylanase [Clostridiales bacterium]|jgi:endo-1,4-beta-xylanase|nr:endo-1,4-beta-xylanase [Clostridiales bacterium]